MNIRAAVPADAEAMARMHWLSANTAYGRDDPLERRLAAAQRIFDEDETRPFVAEHDDGAVVGVLTVGDDELYAIYVHPDYWGTGVGQALLERAETELAKTCATASLTCAWWETRAPAASTNATAGASARRSSSRISAASPPRCAATTSPSARKLFTWSDGSRS